MWWIDPEAAVAAELAAVDAELGTEVGKWGALSVTKTEQAIDALVDKYDPGALRRSRESAQDRTVEFGSPGDTPGMSSMWARMYAPDAVVVQQRVEEMARSVCELDPRTLAERRADSLVALAAGAELACECGQTTCQTATDENPQKNAVVYVVADADTVEAANSVPTGPDAAPRCKPASPQPTQQCSAPPAFVFGGGILPAALLTATLERATTREIVHPANRHPSRATYRRARWPTSCGAGI